MKTTLFSHLQFSPPRSRPSLPRKLLDNCSASYHGVFDNLNYTVDGAR